mmetsp:Transcript_11697/g.31496  ORF Transcript_11697/g.31496 Transcript_11697/m.31496 type:complete len:444 (-) Transcript_11697:1355-2686(-)
MEGGGKRVAKPKAWKCGQRERRELFLKNVRDGQDAKRAAKRMEAISAIDVSPASFDAEEGREGRREEREGEGEEGERMEEVKRGNGRRGPKGRMLKRRRRQVYLNAPEFLIEVPDDLATDWLVAPRPMGSRCLVVSGRRETTAKGRNGKMVCPPFRSRLPTGTLLDCIYVQAGEDNMFWVVDVLRWGDFSTVESPSEMRILFFRDGKLAEQPELQVITANNQRVFRPLPFFDSSPSSILATYLLLSALSGQPLPSTSVSSPSPHPHPLHPFLSSLPPATVVEAEGTAASHLSQLAGWERAFQPDGLLFCHRHSEYDFGYSPLYLAWRDEQTSMVVKEMSEEGKVSHFFRYESGSLRTDDEPPVVLAAIDDEWKGGARLVDGDVVSCDVVAIEHREDGYAATNLTFAGHAGSRPIADSISKVVFHEQLRHGGGVTIAALLQCAQ